MKLHVIDINIPVRINGLLYKQVETTELQKGDLVLDLRDGCYGTVDTIHDQHIAIRNGCVAEVGIPVSRVRKLVLQPDHTNLN